MKWTEAYEHSGRTITVPVKLIHAIGPKGALFIAQLFFWKGKQKDEEGWIYKTKLELEEETGLSRWEQDKCVEDLKKKKILETKYDRLDHRLYYRIHTDTLDTIMEADSPSESGKTTFGKAEKPLSRNPENRFRYKETREYNRDHTQEKRRRSIKAPRAASGKVARRSRRFFLAE
jgi:hypothetical protein